MFYLRHNLVLCILVLISLVFLSPIAVAGPKLVCKDTVCDFGRLEDQTAVEHSFLLENHGDQDLVIQKVRKCCGGAAKLHSTTISPGSNTILEATLSFMGKTGKILKAYYVQSNHPQNHPQGQPLTNNK